MCPSQCGFVFMSIDIIINAVFNFSEPPLNTQKRCIPKQQTRRNRKEKKKQRNETKQQKVLFVFCCSFFLSFGSIFFFRPLFGSHGKKYVNYDYVFFFCCLYVGVALPVYWCVCVSEIVCVACVSHLRYFIFADGSRFYCLAATRWPPVASIRPAPATPDPLHSFELGFHFPAD